MESRTYQHRREGLHGDGDSVVGGRRRRRRRKGGGEGGCGAGVEVIGGRLCAGEDIDTDGVRCLAGGAQNGATPLFMACQGGRGEVVKLLLVDERVDVNQARKVRVGGEGEGGWRERAGRADGALQSVVCVTAEGGRSSHQQGGGCEGWRAGHTSKV